MIVLRVELHPGGNPRGGKLLAELEIRRVSTHDDGEWARYVVTHYQDGQPGKAVSFNHRPADDVLTFVRKALGALEDAP